MTVVLAVSFRFPLILNLFSVSELRFLFIGSEVSSLDVRSGIG